MSLQIIRNPVADLHKMEYPLLIDEVQKAPEIFLRIKMIVDKSNKCGDFWLTGSQKFSLMQNVSDSLAGRVAVLDLQGLSQSEKQTASPTLDMTKNFSLIPDNKRGKGAILSLTSTFMPMRRDVYSIPIAYI